VEVTRKGAVEVMRKDTLEVTRKAALENAPAPQNGAKLKHSHKIYRKMQFR